MGYCDYYPAGNGNYVARWVGTDGEKVPFKKVIYLPRSSTGNAAKDKQQRCADARRQFCIANTGNANCNAPKGESLISRMQTGNKFPEEVQEEEKRRVDKIKADNDAADRNKAICAKQCGWDIICNIDKAKENCGGTFSPCESFPPPFNNCWLVGGIAAAVVIGIILLK